jgi:hypothetical protein
MRETVSTRNYAPYESHDGDMPHLDMSRAVGGTFRASGPKVQDVMV